MSCTYRVTMLIPTAELSSNACYAMRSMMSVLGNSEHVQLAELVVWMELTDEQVGKLQMQMAEVLAELRAKYGVTIKLVVAVELVQYGE